MRVISLENIGQDLRFAGRMLQRNFGFTAAAVLILALGIGGNTAIFTVTSAMLLRPLPFHDPQQLVLIDRKRKEDRKETPGMDCTLARFEQLRDRSQSFSGVAAATNDSLNLTVHGEAEPRLVGDATRSVIRDDDRENLTCGSVSFVEGDDDRVIAGLPHRR